MMKLWGGRFQKDTDQLVNELNASISFDQRLYREDITGSMAHAQMLADCGIISQEDAAAIIDGTVREGDQVTVDVDKDGGFTVVCDNTPAATYEVPDAE